MSNLDVEIKTTLKIYNLHAESTILQVEVPYLGKTIEVNVPNNIQEGHKIRYKGLGCISKNGEHHGDLFIVISKIIYSINGKENTSQKIMIARNNDFTDINYYLDNGWRALELKPFRNSDEIYVYVLLEKC